MHNQQALQFGKENLYLMENERRKSDISIKEKRMEEGHEAGTIIFISDLQSNRRPIVMNDTECG